MHACLLDWVKCIAISMCNQVHMEDTESKRLCTLLAGAIFLLVIQISKGHEAYAHAYHQVIYKPKA